LKLLDNANDFSRAIPSWLHDIFLGYGSPSSAHYRNMPTTSTVQAARNLALTSGLSTTALTSEEDLEIADYRDTFLNYQHLIDSFPDADVSFSDDTGNAIKIDSKKKSPVYPQPPFKLYIKRRSGDGGRDQIRAVPYTSINMGPFIQDIRPKNTVR
jgi:intron-binding protein aquarius